MWPTVTRGAVCGLVRPVAWYAAYCYTWRGRATWPHSLDPGLRASLRRLLRPIWRHIYFSVCCERVLTMRDRSLCNWTGRLSASASPSRPTTASPRNPSGRFAPHPEDDSTTAAVRVAAQWGRIDRSPPCGGKKRKELKLSRKTENGLEWVEDDPLRYVKGGTRNVPQSCTDKVRRDRRRRPDRYYISIVQ